MILIVDTFYGENWARVAGVTVESPDARQVWQEYTVMVADPAPYEPGQFYKRELPGLLELLKTLPKQPDRVIIDGYCEVGGHDGLGNHLYNATQIPVIGLAKTPYVGANAEPVVFGKGSKPLYLSSAGISLSDAQALVQRLESPHRIPTLVKRADQLSRGIDQFGRHFNFPTSDP